MPPGGRGNREAHEAHLSGDRTISHMAPGCATVRIRNPRVYGAHGLRSCDGLLIMEPQSIPGGSGGYELHQKLRTKTVRLLRKNKFDEAIVILYDGCIQLLDMKEEGSACDLAEYLLDVYMKGDVPMNDESRSMCLYDLIRPYYYHLKQNKLPNVAPQIHCGCCQVVCDRMPPSAGR